MAQEVLPPEDESDDSTSIVPVNGHALQVIDPNDPVVLSKKAPLESARIFVNRTFIHNGWRTLQHQQSQFLHWTGTHYAEIPVEEMRGDIYKFLEQCRVAVARPDGTFTEGPFHPSTASVNNILDATRAVAQLKGNPSQPSWLSPDPDLPDPKDMIAANNCLLHLPTGAEFALTPNFYSNAALTYDYDPYAPTPTAWFDFLNTLWPEDPDAISTLQDVFGYLLGNDTNQQKIPLIVGPKRSGKGTIARVLTAMVGQNAVISPTLNSLEGNFGVSPLIGKRIALIADARMGGRADQQVIAERLLSISGEDIQTVDRKHMDAWTGRLPTRFLIMTNELPRIADASGALASRFIILTMKLSFYGQEDHGLTDRLLKELPGILNWAIDGWKNLRERGYFDPPKSSDEALQELADLSSPISAFLRDRCTIAPGKTVSVDGLYHEWEDWCRDQGRDHTGTKQTFGRDLKSAAPGITTKVVRNTVGLSRAFEGIGLLQKSPQSSIDYNESI